jgi:transcription antitermination factor NusG
MSWKVLYVASRSEKKVNQRIQEIEIEVYLPLKSEKKQWSDRLKTVVSPLINGYIFVNVSDKDRDKVLSINGVLNYVRYNGGDAIVRDEEILALKNVEDNGYFVELQSNLEIGVDNKVLIEYGPFKGLEGIVSEDGNNNIFSIKVSIIGYDLTVKVPKEVLIKV